MKEENLIFVKQLLNSLEKKMKELAEAKKENDPRKFNEIKKECLKLNGQIGELIK